jgi:hypothetical protein
MTELQMFLEGNGISHKQALLRTAYLLSESSDETIAALYRIPEMRAQIDEAHSLLESDDEFIRAASKLMEAAPAWLARGAQAVAKALPTVGSIAGGVGGIALGSALGGVGALAGGIGGRMGGAKLGQAAGNKLNNWATKQLSPQTQQTSTGSKQMSWGDLLTAAKNNNAAALDYLKKLAGSEQYGANIRQWAKQTGLVLAESRPKASDFIRIPLLEDDGTAALQAAMDAKFQQIYQAALSKGYTPAQAQTYASAQTTSFGTSAASAITNMPAPTALSTPAATGQPAGEAVPGAGAPQGTPIPLTVDPNAARPTPAHTPHPFDPTHPKAAVDAAITDFRRDAGVEPSPSAPTVGANTGETSSWDEDGYLVTRDAQGNVLSAMNPNTSEYLTREQYAAHVQADEAPAVASTLHTPRHTADPSLMSAGPGPIEGYPADNTLAEDPIGVPTDPLELAPIVHADPSALVQAIPQAGPQLPAGGHDPDDPRFQLHNNMMDVSGDVAQASTGDPTFDIAIAAAAAFAGLIGLSGVGAISKAIQNKQLQNTVGFEGDDAKKMISSTCVNVLKTLQSIRKEERPDAIEKGLAKAGKLFYMTNGQWRQLKDFASLKTASKDLPSITAFKLGPAA